jgi:hypothetical protein
MPRPKYWFYGYSLASGSMQALNENLNGRIIKHRNSSYVQGPEDILINWGSARELPYRNMVNNPMAVRVATSKLSTFRALSAANIVVPSFTQDRSVAVGWNARLLGRDQDHGSQGAGIHVYHQGDTVGNHQFYVKYWRKEREFRVHVFKGRVIFIQEKLRKRVRVPTSVLPGSSYIRSHNRGWCFAFNHLSTSPCPSNVSDAAVAAVQALGLDFGGVDIGWNERHGAAVFEVNTAPGLEETSLQAYVEAFKTL